MDLIKTYEIKRWDGSEITPRIESVAREYPFTLNVNGEEFVTLLCSPSSLKHLAVGYLFAEGLIHSLTEIKDIKINEELGLAEIILTGGAELIKELKNKRTLTSGCGKGTTFFTALDFISLKSKNIESKFTILGQTVLKQMLELNSLSHNFLKTGGVHSGAFSNGCEILLFQEDIGRHNVIDKLVGEALTKEIDLTEGCLFISGRISSEMVIKAGRVGVPVLVSRSAPMDLALNMAEVLGLTVLGFTRGKRMNIYTNGQRIIL